MASDSLKEIVSIETEIDDSDTGTETIITNLQQVAESVNRPALCIAKYLQWKMEAQVDYHFDTEKFAIEGSHDKHEIQEFVNDFVQQYIKCNCGSLQTECIVDNNGSINMICKICKRSGLLNPMDPVNSFLLRKYDFQASTANSSKEVDNEQSAPISKRKAEHVQEQSEPKSKNAKIDNKNYYDRLIGIDYGMKLPIAASILHTNSNQEEDFKVTSNEYHTAVGNKSRNVIYRNYLKSDNRALSKLQKTLQLTNENDPNQAIKRLKYEAGKYTIKKETMKRRKTLMLKKDHRIAVRKYLDNVINSKLIGEDKKVFIAVGKNVPKVGKGYIKGPLKQITTLLSNKSLELGKEITIVEVDEFNTTQVCQYCGHKNSSIGNTPHRFYKCLTCGRAWNRDLNAAVNIRNIGLVDAGLLLKENVPGNEHFHFQADKKKKPRKPVNVKINENICKSCGKCGHSTSKSKECENHILPTRDVLLQANLEQNPSLINETVTSKLKFNETIKEDELIYKIIGDSQDFVQNYSQNLTILMNYALNDDNIVHHLATQSSEPSLKSYGLILHGGHVHAKTNFPRDEWSQIFETFKSETNFHQLDARYRSNLIDNRVKELKTAWKNLISTTLFRRIAMYFKRIVKRKSQLNRNTLNHLRTTLRNLKVNNLKPKYKWFQNLLQGTREDIDFTKVEQQYWKFIPILKKIRDAHVQNGQRGFKLFPDTNSNSVLNITIETCGLVEHFKRYGRNVLDGEMPRTEQQIRELWDQFITLKEKDKKRFTGRIVLDKMNVNINIYKKKQN